MQKVFAGEPYPDSIIKSIYLAGPSPRDPGDPNWRTEATEFLQRVGYDGHVFIPLARDGEIPKDYIAQADWEQGAMSRSDIVLFWVPRDLEKLPGFTTNVEFGQKCKNRNVVFGSPDDAPKTAFLKYLADKCFLDTATTLEDTLALALERIGDGAPRVGGECEVPLYLWRTKHFADWWQAQKGAGNRLDGCNVELTFGVGPKKAFLLFWAAHVDIYVAAERRNKNNEIVLSRPDIKHTVGYCPAENLFDSKIVLVREFRSTAATKDGFVHEVPGGSGFQPTTPLEHAVSEFEEETGLALAPDRLRTIATRQLASTTSAHKAHVFAVELTKYEIASLEKGGTFGNPDETELTHVEVMTVQQLLDNPITDWVNLGMIFAALKGSAK